MEQTHRQAGNNSPSLGQSTRESSVFSLVSIMKGIIKRNCKDFLIGLLDAER